MAATTTGGPSLDLEALLSKDYRPARVSRLILNDLYAKHQQSQNHANAKKHPHRLLRRAEDKTKQQQQKRRLQEEETSRLVMSLVTQTPAFLQHLPVEDQIKHQKEASQLLTTFVSKNNTHTQQRGNNSHVLAVYSNQPHHRIAPEFHPINLVDWEKQIDWGDDAATTSSSEIPPTTSQIDTTTGSSNALALLQKPRNLHLDTLTFDSCFDDSPTRNRPPPPLILELSVAGQSVGRHVYQHTVLTAQRPLPAAQCDDYQNRLDRDWSANGGDLNITSTAELSKKSSLRADKDQMNLIIAERQKKRAAMAKDKTNRVLEAMGTLAAMGGGRGRTITSSLMGPGGTERTGRPSRVMGASAATVNHEAEYVEQLDLVNSVSVVC
jgi:hypothetical protein